MQPVGRPAFDCSLPVAAGPRKTISAVGSGWQRKRKADIYTRWRVVGGGGDGATKRAGGRSRGYVHPAGVHVRVGGPTMGECVDLLFRGPGCRINSNRLLKFCCQKRYFEECYKKIPKNIQTNNRLLKH